MRNFKGFEENDTSLVLKNYFQAPIFTATMQENIRIVKVGDDIWAIGVDNPLKPRKEVVRSLTIDHAVMILGIFSFTNSFEFPRKIPFSFNKLCQKLYGNSSARTYNKAKELIDDILSCWTRITYPDGDARDFRVLKNADILRKQRRKNKAKNKGPELWLDSVELHEEYYKLISNIENRLCVRISLVTQLTSNLARTIYLYLPSRAINASKEGNVFKITLAKLLGQIGCEVPKHKSRRYQLFTQHKTSILSQLDGAKLLGDKTLRCRLEETSDKKDYNLVCWVEFPKGVSINEPSNSVLYEAFISAGGTLTLWRERLSRIGTCEFDMYEIEALEYIPDWETSKPFLLMVKCLMGGLFTECLGIVKNHVLEGKDISKSPLHKLNNEIMEAIKKMKI
jgi:hypothetical protein